MSDGSDFALRFNGFGCLGFVLGASALGLVIWVTVFGVTIDGRHYDVGCRKDGLRIDKGEK